MVQIHPRGIGMIHAVLSLLAGAGFAVTALSLFLLAASDFDLYSFSVGMTEELPVGPIFYGYGLACSLGIEGLMYFIPSRGMTRQWRMIGRISLYVAAGYAYFLFHEMNVFTVIAGTVGAVCALAVCAGIQLAGQSNQFRYGFALIAPLILFTLLQFDFTVKRGWVKTATASSFEASFDYFNGKHEIPIYADEGQTITFRIQLSGEGGHGYHVLNSENNLVPMHDQGEGTRSVHADAGGIYRIVVTGDDFQGSMRVVWEIEQPSG